ncbi:response regulator [Vibrio parahaemolyticus]|uniref:response regulator n=1 Tax=Vibrio parahaemolyticus TaxID=670 RepID=UPI00111D3BE7|nr:response regulator [Vibrio parahaemolyticus]MDF4497834.1 response regulator [Vibrio parahaemolyticus]MDG3377920.1 response regulator [Vibrio parahaemolyticus]TOF63143.1 hypothetical protein CGJ19_21955 [Vibrio parahaemolyticus]
MKILHLEDDKSWFDRVVKPALEGINNVEVYHATHKEDAISHLEQHDIDLALLDLAVPLDDPNGVPELQYGLSVAWHIRTCFPGIPIFILTGQSTDEAAERFEEENTFTTFWDGQEKPLVRLRKKRRLPDVIGDLNNFAESLYSLNQIELDFDRRTLTLEKFDERVIRLFCSKHGAIAARITPLSEGLSSAKVLYVQLINKAGQPYHYTLAKIDQHRKVDAEKQNYHDHVTKLAVGCFAGYLDEYYAGCSDRKGVFFQFAVQYRKDYFDAYNEGDQTSLQVATATKNIFTNWTQVRSPNSMTVGDIRRYLCSDEKFNSLSSQLVELGIDINEFESKILRSNVSIQHADLHGMNILLSDNNVPIVIDYGDIKQCPAVIDPITLELSHYFHPKMKDVVVHNLELASNWFSDRDMVALSSNPLTANFLRSWSRENSFLRSDYTAGVYAYAVRQMTYGDTDKDFAKVLIKAAVEEFG